MVQLFDERNPSNQIHDILVGLSNLPVRLRLRSTETYKMVGSFFKGIQSIIHASMPFCPLSIDAQRTRSKHNLDSTGALHGIFICQELDLFRNETFYNAASLYYGSDFLHTCTRNAQRCEQNGALMKIFLFIMTYSSNSSIVTLNLHEPISDIRNSLALIHLQDIYVTILWKYLVYLYGYEQAVSRMCSLVKNILDILHMLETMPVNEKHQQMVETIAEETEKLLVITN
jgi:hypothetical protein